MNLSDLRTAARQRADEEATGFISNSELNGYINQGQKHCYAQMVQRFEMYFVIPGTVSNGGQFTTVSGQQLYAMPSGYHKLIRVEMRAASSNDDRDFYRLDKVNIANYDFSARYPYQSQGSFEYGYFLAGNKIGLRPIPQDTSNTIRVWYVPTTTLLADDADIPEIPEMYHELIAEYAAIKCLSKSGEGIYQEKWAEFTLELKNLVDTIETRDQKAESMVFSNDDGGDFLESHFPWAD